MLTEKFNSILQYTAMNNSVYDYLKMLITVVISLAVLLIIKKIILVKLERWSRKTITTLDDFIVSSLQKYLIPVLYYTSIYISIQHIKLHATLLHWFGILGFVICIVSAIRFLTALILFIVEKKIIREQDINKKTTVLTAIKTLITILFWSIALILFLDNMGIRITGLVAGLGIGGVAVAFAAQAMLQDIFSYFTIFVDRPFEIGDFLIIDKYMGEVEHIGVKTTRIKSLSGEQLIFSNKDLTSSRLRNFKRMAERRVAFKFGVVYETTTEILKEIPGLIQGIIDSIDDARFDRCHFYEYGDFSLNFETVYYINTNDYAVYMNVQQEINLKIKEAFEQKAVEFAYPTQLLYVKK